MSARERRALVIAAAALASALFLVWAILSAPSEPTRSELISSNPQTGEVLNATGKGSYSYSSDPDELADQPARLRETPKGWKGWVRAPEITSSDSSTEKITVRSSVFYTSSTSGDKALREGLLPTPDQVVLSIQWIDRDSPLYEITSDNVGGYSRKSSIGKMSILSDGATAVVFPWKTDGLILITAKTPEVLVRALDGLKINPGA